MPEPALHEIERRAGLKRADAEAVTKSPWTGGPAGDATAPHDVLDDAPGCYAVPRPKAAVCNTRIKLPRVQFEPRIHRSNQRRWDRNFADAEAATFQRVDRSRQGDPSGALSARP